MAIDLPFDILLRIFKYLDSRSRLNFIRSLPSEEERDAWWQIDLNVAVAEDWWWRCAVEGPIVAATLTTVDSVLEHHPPLVGYRRVEFTCFLQFLARQGCQLNTLRIDLGVIGSYIFEVSDTDEVVSVVRVSDLDGCKHILENIFFQYFMNVVVRIPAAYSKMFYVKPAVHPLITE